MTHNLAQCQRLVEKAAAAGAKALFLPEAADYIAPDAKTSLSICVPAANSPFVLGLCSAARTHKVAINVGIHEPSSVAPGLKVKNTLIWIDELGQVTHRYQKLHLFDVSIANGPNLRESDSVEQGTQIEEPHDTALGKVGMLICFDLRFPEVSQALRHRGAQIITYPSAFTVPTGRAHWSTLLRARAIETQSYVIAAAQCGLHQEGGKRQSYGHGMIVDPWGKVIGKLGGVGNDGEVESGNLDIGEIAISEIDLNELERIRNEVPLCRRGDVYGPIS